MKNIILGVALCFGVFSVPVAAHAESLAPKEMKECEKKLMSAECAKNFEKLQKAFEDIAKGKKPTLALESLPIGELAKFLSVK